MQFGNMFVYGQKEICKTFRGYYRLLIEYVLFNYLRSNLRVFIKQPKNDNLYLKIFNQI